MIRETIVPAIPDIRDDNVKDVLRAIKATLDVREGSIGDPLDQLVTLRDLTDLNLAASGGSTGTLAGGVLPVSAMLPPVVGGYNPATDFTTPPAPAGLRARGGAATVYLEWDGAPYRNHGYTEIWRASVDALAQATFVGTTAASVYADPVVADTTYFYWIRFVSTAAVTGPYNQSSGTSATTVLDLGAALTTLSNELQSSQLFVDLGTRVRAIETDAYVQSLTSGAVKSQLDQLSAGVTSANSQITSLRAVNDAQATLLTAVKTQAGAASAAVTTLEQTKIGYATLNATGAVFDNDGAITSQAGVEAWNLANSNNLATWNVGLPLATAVKQVGVTDGTDTLTLEQRFTAQKQTNSDLYGQYTVKIDNKGHVSGFGLASGAVNGTPSSAFIVRADRFGIAGVNDANDPLGTLAPTSKPFMVLTAATELNGKTYPAGTWIDTAFIANATITNAQITDLTADKLTAGSVSAALGLTTGKLWGGVAVSSNKDNGTFGNLLHNFASVNFGTGFFLGKDGDAYKFYVGKPDQNMNWNGSALTVTGTLNAVAGNFRNINVYDSENRVILSSGGVNRSLLGLGTLAALNEVPWTSVADRPTTLAALDATAATDLDGRTVTYYQDAAPTGTVNDLWFDTNDGNKLYRHDGTDWVVVQDAAIAAAAGLATTAQTTADTKITTYYTTTAPTTASTGDLWYNATTKLLQRWSGSAWVTSGNYVDNTNQLTDGAKLGETALWTSVANRPTTLAALDATAATDLDGKTITYYQDAAPAGTVNDLWFDTDDGNKLYRHDGTDWVVVQDAGIAAAAGLASTAQTTANSKITTYYATTAPTAPAVGDLWYNSETRLLQRWSGSAWVSSGNYVDNTNQLTDGANLGQTASWTSVAGRPTTLAALDATAASDLDGKTITYYQDAAPTGTVNDLWFDTNDGNKLYRHDGADWVVVQDAAIADAAGLASTAQATADGKVTTFYAASAPTAEGVGDLWYNSTTRELKRWNGSAWDISGNFSTEVAGNGTNLCNPRYATFEEASLPPVTFDRGEATLDATVGYIGSKSIKLLASAADHYCYLGSSSSDYNFPITAGQKYIVSGYVRASLTNAAGQFYVRTNDAGSTHHAVNFTASTTVNQWTRVSGTFTTPAACTRAILRIDNDAGNGVAMWYDGLMIEPAVGQGTNPSPFVAPPNFRTSYTGDLSATRNTVFRQATAPTGASVNDLWFKTDTKAVYYWDGSAWVLAGDVTATNTAAGINGQGTLATQSSVFVGSTVKFDDGSVLNTGDFVNRLTKIGTGNISTFVSDAAIGNAYIGDLNAAKITAGTLSADRIAAGSITAAKINSSGLEIKDSNGNVILRSGSAPINSTPTFSVVRRWDFDGSTVVSNSVDGFEAWELNYSASGSSITLTPTGNDPQLKTPDNLHIDGSLYDKVQIRIKRTGGTGWNGFIIYKTTAHALLGTYYKLIPDGTVLNTWVTLEWDMATLDGGGDDWITSTIEQLRIDFGASVDDKFEIDWIAIGRYSAAPAHQITPENASTFIKALAVDTLQIAGNAVTIPLTYESSTSYNATGTVLTYNFTMPEGGKVIVLWQGQTDSARQFFFRLYLNVTPGAGSAEGYSYVGFPNGDYEYESGTYSYVGEGAGDYLYTPAEAEVPNIGNTRTGGVFEDAPTAIGFGTAVAGSNTLRVYWQRNEGGTLTYQRLIILGAQR